MGIKINPQSTYFRLSGFGKRWNGFLVYLLAAFASLICPVVVDRSMYRTLKTQFVEEDSES